MNNEKFYGHGYEFKTLIELESIMDTYKFLQRRENTNKIKRPNSLLGEESSFIMSIN